MREKKRDKLYLSKKVLNKFLFLLYTNLQKNLMFSIMITIQSQTKLFSDKISLPCENQKLEIFRFRAFFLGMKQRMRKKKVINTVSLSACVFVFVCLSVSLSVWLSMRLSVSLSVCLFFCLFVCQFVCLSVC